MTELSTKDRLAVWGEMIIQIANEGTDPTTLLDDISAAVEAVDTWIDGQQVGYNTALPEPFKTWATARLKAWLLVAVVLKRFNVGTE